MTLDDILAMWEKDCVIKEFNLDDTTIETSKLHAKYLQILSMTKLQIKKAESDFDVLLKNKWEWYNGRMDKNSIDNLGWAYDPFDGCNKPLKSDMERFYKADSDIQRMQNKIDYLTTIKETVEEIINTLRWRHQSVRNIIDFRKFESGM